MMFPVVSGLLHRVMNALRRWGRLRHRLATFRYVFPNALLQVKSHGFFFSVPFSLELDLRAILTSSFSYRKLFRLPFSY